MARFFSMVHHFKLTVQHRCEDAEFQEILNHVRHYKPYQHLLNILHKNRVIISGNTPTDLDIHRALVEHPESTVVTVTRNATNRVNKVAIDLLFQDEIPLAVVQSNCEFPPVLIYKDMSVIITQNRDKLNHVVNGQRATVHMVERRTVFLKLPSGNIVNVYIVTSTTEQGNLERCYPFVPGYAVTICKSQGQQLNKIILWMDSLYVPEGAGYVALSRVQW